MSDEDATLTENSAEQENYEQRFKDTQSAFTRSQQELAQERASWEDEATALARLAEKFPHLFEDEDEDTYEDDVAISDVPEPRDSMTAAEIAALKKQTAELQAWQQAQVATQGQARFESDLAEVAGERTISKQGKDWIGLQVSRGTNDRAALEAATKEWFDYEDGVRTAAKAKPKPRARAPHVIPGGQTATGQKAWSEMTRAEALAAQVEMANALDTQY